LPSTLRTAFDCWGNEEKVAITGKKIKVYVMELLLAWAFSIFFSEPIMQPNCYMTFVAIETIDQIVFSNLYLAKQHKRELTSGWMKVLLECLRFLNNRFFPQ